MAFTTHYLSTNCTTAEAAPQQQSTICNVSSAASHTFKSTICSIHNERFCAILFCEHIPPDGALQCQYGSCRLSGLWLAPPPPPLLPPPPVCEPLPLLAVMEEYWLSEVWPEPVGLSTESTTVSLKFFSGSNSKYSCSNNNNNNILFPILQPER